VTKLQILCMYSSVGLFKQWNCDIVFHSNSFSRDNCPNYRFCVCTALLVYSDCETVTLCSTAIHYLETSDKIMDSMYVSVLLFYLESENLRKTWCSRRTQTSLSRVTWVSFVRFGHWQWGDLWILLFNEYLKNQVRVNDIGETRGFHLIWQNSV
jgi:hypothetical protein